MQIPPKTGIGFSFFITPVFSTGRTDLRIHPDGNGPGTLGCIGLVGSKELLLQFSDLAQQALIFHGNYSFRLIIDIQGNPNHSKPYVEKKNEKRPNQ